MPQTSVGSVDHYIAARPAAQQPILERVRAAIRGALPNARERLSYAMPAYDIDGNVAIYFAGWKYHYSLYPVDARVVAALGEDLTKHAIEKSTIRFAFSDPVPETLIARIAKFRADELSESRA